MGVNELLSDQAAEEVRAMLARRRMSGRKLAERLHVSHTWVSQRLTGQQEIGLNELQRIAEALDVDLHDLLPRPTADKTSRYSPGEVVLATVGQPRDRPTAIRRPVKLRRPSRRSVAAVAA